MNIYIDDEKFEPTTVDYQNNKRLLLNEISRYITKQGRTFSSVLVDGNEIDYNAFARISGGLDVRITTTGIRELIIESSEEGAKYLPRLIRGGYDIASNFEMNIDSQSQLGKLADFTEGLNWVVSVIKKNTTLLQIAEQWEDDLVSVMEPLNAGLSKILECIENTKWQEIAFHLRQSIMPNVEKLPEFFQKLISIASNDKI